MTIANPKLNRLKAVDVQQGSGSLTPTGSIADGLLITQDANITLDQLEQNSQDDVVSPSLGNRATIIGSKAGTATINGNLTSFGTKVSKEPAITPYLEMCGMAKTSVDQLLLVASATNVVYGTLLEETGGATGTVRGIVDDVIYYEATAGTFAPADVVTVVGSGDPVGTVDTYTADVGKIFKPDSNSNTVGSIYVYDDGIRKSLASCAGNFSINCESSQFAKFSMNFMGKYDEANWVDVAIPSVVYSDDDPPLLLNSQMKLNFGTVFVPINTSVTYNLGATPALRRNSVDETGVEGGFVSSRADASGAVTIEDENEAAFPYIEKMLASEVGTLDWNLTDNDNRPVIFIHQTVNITGATGGDDNGIESQTLDFKCIDVNLDDGDSSIMFV